MARTAKTFADKMEEHMFIAPIEECKDIVGHAQRILRMREGQMIAAMAEAARQIAEAAAEAKRLEEAARP